VRGEIDSKFELLVANKNSLEDIQIVSFWKSSFFLNIAFGFFQHVLMLHLFGCKWVLMPYFVLSCTIW
jgi:hypothetical protein